MLNRILMMLLWMAATGCTLAKEETVDWAGAMQITRSRLQQDDTDAAAQLKALRKKHSEYRVWEKDLKVPPKEWFKPRRTSELDQQLIETALKSTAHWGITLQEKLASLQADKPDPEDPVWLHTYLEACELRTATAFVREARRQAQQAGNYGKAVTEQFTAMMERQAPLDDPAWKSLLQQAERAAEQYRHQQGERKSLQARITRINFAAMERAIRDLISMHGDRYPRGPEWLDALPEWEKERPGVLEDLKAQTPEALAQARQYTERVEEPLLANPLLDMDRLLVLRRRLGAGARSLIDARCGFPGLNSHTNDDIPHRGWDNEMVLLSDLRSAKKARQTLYRPPNGEIVRDLDLEFDGERLMFSSIGAHDRWALFETDLKRGVTRQISPVDLPDVDFFDSCYLPDGRIASCSTAGFQGLPCENGGRPMVNLFLLSPDSGNIRQLTFEQDSDYHPCVLPNGRLMYIRWEYSDLMHYYSRILFHCNPDGTNQIEYYGSGSLFPTCMKHPRPLPDGNGQVVAILGGHHSVPESGRMVLIDPSLSRRYPMRYRPATKEWGVPGTYINLVPDVLPAARTGMLQEIPGFGKEVVGNIHDGQGNEPTQEKKPRFVYPWPLSENYLLVSAKPEPDALWGIYLVDVFDNMTLIHEEEDIAFFEPVPLVAQTRPPIIQDRVDLTQTTANAFITDIHLGPGLAGIPVGTVKNLRIFAYHFAYNRSGGHASVGVESSWDIKRVLGTVPVEDDGSVAFTIPANTPIALQPLDEEGRALQLMRSWLVGKPGENLSCVGCHENQNSATPVKPTIAATKGPRAIQPWHGAPRPFSFAYEVHPVLQKFCLGCHDGQARNQDPALLAFTEDRKAYNNLHPFVRRPGPESDQEMAQPMEYHASTSPLIQMLKKGHHGVELDREAWERLYTWIDLNAPYRGQWAPDEWRGVDQVERRKELATLYAGVNTDPESEYEAVASAYRQRPAVEPVPPRRQAPKKPDLLSCPEWPFTTGEARARQEQVGASTREIQLGQNREGEPIMLPLRRIPGGSFIMGCQEGYPDETPRSVVEIPRPYWMGTLEVSNDLYSLFNPEHDTRYYDEHGKDLAVPGYIGNHGAQPVARVSWQEATAFCAWLSDRLQRPVRLPTEAQWEWAARAGTETPFYYGDMDADFAPFANLSDHTRLFTATSYNGGSHIHKRNSHDPNHHFPLRDDRFDDGCMVTHYVGQYRANAWGLQDMIGNVAEWTRSAYQAYPFRPSQEAQSDDLSIPRVARGGSWYDRPRTATASIRQVYPTFQKVFNVGFRVVIED